MEKEFSFKTAMITNADGADVSLQNTDHSTQGNADIEVLFRDLTENSSNKSIQQMRFSAAWLG